MAFNPKITSFSTEERARSLQDEILERKRQREENVATSRRSLAGNIILPKIAQFQFAEYASIRNEGNVSYIKADIEDLFKDGWETFRATLPDTGMIARELKACRIGASEYDSFLRDEFNRLCKEGVIEMKTKRELIDLGRCGSVYQPRPNVWISTKSGKHVPSNLKLRKRNSYALKEGTEWHELMRKALSHDNPIGITMDSYSMGYDSYRDSLSKYLSRPSYLDFESKLGKDIEERIAERKDSVDPNLALRLTRLHSNLTDFYKDATRSVVMKHGPRPGMVTRDPALVLDLLACSLPETMGKILYDASGLADHDLGWPWQLMQNISEINASEMELGKSKYPAVKIREIIMKTVPFAFKARDDMESALGYGKKMNLLL